MRKSIVLTTAALFVAAAAVACPSSAVAKSKGRVQHNDISVTKATDKSSPQLFRSITAPRDAATGQATGKRR